VFPQLHVPIPSSPTLASRALGAARASLVAAPIAPAPVPIKTSRRVDRAARAVVRARAPRASSLARASLAARVRATRGRFARAHIARQ
jgi:hypothetical protein